jgi:hypothetical protein
MGDLRLTGMLNLQGTLDLAPAVAGGKVLAGGLPVLVVPGAKGKATVPVLLPPPPAKPTDTGFDVAVIVSFNQSVTAGGKAIVTQGMCLQGDMMSWPGMVAPSVGNAGVKVNNVAMNVENDQATILPTGAPAVLNTSGQS